jgi:hypothetical protein
MKELTTNSDPLPNTWSALLIVAGWIVVSLALGSLTLRRRTP